MIHKGLLHSNSPRAMADRPVLPRRLPIPFLRSPIGPRTIPIFLIQSTEEVPLQISTLQLRLP